MTDIPSLSFKIFDWYGYGNNNDYGHLELLYNDFNPPPDLSQLSADGLLADVGNIYADPLFVDPYYSDFHLSPDSPAIDSGTSDGIPETDLDGKPRFLGAGVDMGAYEFGLVGDTNNDGVVNAQDVQFVINGALGTGRAADINNDGQTNAVDVQLTIDATLG